MAKPVRSTFGIEEEYFLTDLQSRRVAQGSLEGFAEACQRTLGTCVTREMFAAQFEVVTPVLDSLPEARDYLTGARLALARLAHDFGLGIVAAGTHPLAHWRRVRATDIARYQSLFDDYQVVAARSVLAGVHVHVGIPPGVDRIRLMNRLTPWLPLLLGLSASSPFWNGKPCGLMSYRQAVCDEWPRMGIPAQLEDDAHYQRYVKMLLDTGSMRAPANVWWNIRPSARFPTLELRIADACPRLDDALCIAGLFRAMLAHALATPQQPWQSDPLTRAVTIENRWRAKRHGMRGDFIDPSTQQARPFSEWLHATLEILAPHVAEGDEPFVEHARTMLAGGNSAEAQLACYGRARQQGCSHGEALRAVVGELMAQTELHHSYQ